MCIEVNDYKKISEVTKKINESQVQNKILQTKPSSKFQSPILKKYTNSHDTKDTPNQAESIIQEISFKKEGDNVLFKEIDYAIKTTKYFNF